MYKGDISNIANSYVAIDINIILEELNTFQKFLYKVLPDFLGFLIKFKVNPIAREGLFYLLKSKFNIIIVGYGKFYKRILKLFEKSSIVYQEFLFFKTKEEMVANLTYNFLVIAFFTKDKDLFKTINKSMEFLNWQTIINILKEKEKFLRR